MFNVSEFQKALASENIDSITTQLALFNEILRNVADEVVDSEISDEADAIRSFLSSSPHAVELKKIWKDQQELKIQKFELLILAVLENLLVSAKKVGDAYFVNGMNIARGIVREDMKFVYRNLSSGSIPCIQATLGLLVAIASYSVAVNVELHGCFNFGMKSLSRLLTIRKKTETRDRRSYGRDVRSMYVRYIMSFVIFGDTNVKKIVLEMKDFLSAIFKDIHNDDYDTIQHVLSHLKSHLLDDQSLNRTPKIAFFNNHLLQQLTQLYSRNEKLVDAEDTVADLVHEFMTHLCTTPGTGLCFLDNGWYPKKDKRDFMFNKVLLTVLNNLKPQDPKQLDLLLDILKACPELVVPFTQNMSVSLEPRPSKKWMFNMNLVAKIISLPVPYHFSQNTKTPVPETVNHSRGPPPVKTVIENIVPSLLGSQNIVKALQYSHNTVKYIAAVVVSLCFQKLDTVLAEVKRVCLAAGQSDQSLAQKKWATFENEVVEEIRKRLPDIQVILTIVGTDAVTIPAATAEAEGMDEIEETDSHMLFSAALNLFANYQRFFPDAVAASRFDIGKLLKNITEWKNQETQIAILSAIRDTNDFKWWNMNGTTCHLSFLLRLFLQTGEGAIRSACTQTIIKILSSFYLFQHYPDEIPIFLDTLLDHAQGMDVILPKIDAFLLNAVKNSFYFVDLVTHFLSTASEGLDDLSRACIKYQLGTVRPQKVAEEIQGLIFNINVVAFAKFDNIEYVSFYLDYIKRIAQATQQVDHFVLKLLPDLETVEQQDIKDAILNFKRDLTLAPKDGNAICSCIKLLRVDHGNMALLSELLTKADLSSMNYVLGHPVIQEIFADRNMQLTSALIPPLKRYKFQVESKNLMAYTAQLRDWITEMCEGKVPFYQDAVTLVSLLPSEHILEIINHLLMNQIHGSAVFQEIIAATISCLDSTVVPVKVLGFALKAAAESSETALSGSILSLVEKMTRVSSEISSFQDLVSMDISDLVPLFFSCQAPAKLDILAIFARFNPRVNEQIAHLIRQQQISFDQEDMPCIQRVLLELEVLSRVNSKDPWVLPLVKALLQLVFHNELVHEKAQTICERSSALMNFLSLDNENISDVFDEWALASQLTKVAQPMLALAFLLELDQDRFSHRSFVFCGIQVIRLIIKSKGKVPADQLDTDEELWLRSLVTRVTDIYLQKSETVHDLFDLKDEKIQKMLRLAFISVLKNRLTDPHMGPYTLALSRLVAQAEIFTKANILEMITTHSSFENLIAPMQSNGTDQSRTNLVRLFGMCLDHFTPTSSAHEKYMELLAKNYGGTTSQSDREILSIFQRLESSHKISVANYLMNFFALTSGDSSQILPSYQRLNVDKLHAMISNGLNSTNETSYDVDFVLPMTIHNLVGGTTQQPGMNFERTAALMTDGVDIQEFIERGLIGIILLALSHVTPNTRHVAYFALDRVHALVKHHNPEKLKDKPQIMLLLDNLRNMITDRDTPQRIPAVISLFLAQALSILIKPENHLYPTINQCLLQKAIMDLDDVPMFYNLFNSSSDEHRKDRLWIMKLLSHGITDTSDYKLYKRRHVIELFMSYYNSPFAEIAGKKLVLDTIHRACSTPMVLTDLLSHSGLVSFLHSIVVSASFDTENGLVVALLRVVNKVFSSWVSIWRENGKGVNWLKSFALLFDSAVMRCATVQSIKSKERYFMNVVYEVVVFATHLSKEMDLVSSPLSGLCCLVPPEIEIESQLSLHSTSLYDLFADNDLLRCHISKMLFRAICLTRAESDGEVINWSIKYLSINQSRSNMELWLNWTSSLFTHGHMDQPLSCVTSNVQLMKFSVFPSVRNLASSLLDGTFRTKKRNNEDNYPVTEKQLRMA